MNARRSRPGRGAHISAGVQAAGQTSPRFGLARVLSKRGLCSRTQAAEWIRAGRVSVGGRIVRDPESPTDPARTDIAIDGAAPVAGRPLYLMLNKPRGLVTTVRDERGRDTVYRCFDGATVDGVPLPWIAPVGRLDKASEGLLLFGNDPQWAALITDPATGPRKTYHVQVDRVPDTALLAALERGVVEAGEPLAAASARLLRSGAKNAWLEIVLEEGRNRQIRRLLAAFGIATLRLVRVAIGGLALGDLPRGAWRVLDADDLRRLQGDPSSLDT
jgi:23S rRNA pseudouridine2605 synthase